MRILSLKIKNILSIEELELSFGDSGLILIEGWDYDKGRANGAGKTAIFNCISFALYDKVPRKITATELLRRGCKDGFVECTVMCGKDTWTVHRTRPKGAKFFKNGIETQIVEKEFESKLGLSFEQFLLTVYTPQSNSKISQKFLNCPDADKKSFLLKLLNLEQFYSCKLIVDKQIKDLQSQLDKLTISIASVKTKHEVYSESLIDLNKITKEIVQDEELISSLNKEIVELQTVEKPDLSKFFKMEDDLTLKVNEVQQARFKYSSLMDKHKELSSMIKDYDKNIRCSECNSSLDSQEAFDAHKEHQNKIIQKKSLLKTQMDELALILLNESKYLDLLKKLKEKKNTESIDYQNASKRILELSTLVKARQIHLENTKQRILKGEEAKNKVIAVEKELEEISRSLKEKNNEINILKTLSLIYSPTGAQAYVLDSVIDSFNEVIQKYISLMDPTMTYQLNSYKETSNGTVSAKFSESLIKDGTEISVGSLSGGEEKGLSLCVDFALLEVLETQFNISLNPIILDEAFDGLDAVGREVVVDLLKNLSNTRQIYVVDHHNEAKALFSKVFKVSKRNGVSTLSEEP